MSNSTPATYVGGGQYTDDPLALSTSIYPRSGLQVLSCFIFFTAVAILSFLVSRRTIGLNPISPSSWANYSWPKLICIAVFVSSWLFVYSAGILVLGIGMSRNETSCSLGIFSCIVFYAMSKVFIYLFLVEKVHIISGTNQSRFQSKLYRICLVVMSPYLAIVITMIIGRIAFIDTRRACYIGLKEFSSYSLLGYDLFLNVFLTSLFVVPIFKSKFANPRLKSVATRTMISALAALTTSTINILVLSLMKGKQLGWVCLGSCGSDVTANAVILFFVTQSTTSTDGPTEIAAARGPQSSNNIRSPQAFSNSSKHFSSRNEYNWFPDPEPHKGGRDGDIDEEFAIGGRAPKITYPAKSTAPRQGLQKALVIAESVGGARGPKQTSARETVEFMERQAKERAKVRATAGEKSGWVGSLKSALGIKTGDAVAMRDLAGTTSIQASLTFTSKYRFIWITDPSILQPLSQQVHVNTEVTHTHAVTPDLSPSSSHAEGLSTLQNSPETIISPYVVHHHDDTSNDTAGPYSDFEEDNNSYENGSKIKLNKKDDLN